MIKGLPSASLQTKAARKILSGYRERLALAHEPAAHPRKADPALPDSLRAMLASLDRTILAGQRNAVLLLGYSCAARIFELALNVADVRETPEGLVVTVYRRKLKKFTECKVGYGTNPATCPMRAVRALLNTLDASAVAAGRCWSASTGTDASARSSHARAAQSATRPGG
ncbi:hypothetical protein AB0B45_50750 [Nonomuraea sp. NPDC049152]|uniref:hypothetical protein n=1 Tax=Nonomuraea sp. NPDC049152 TaxID=3154350 RepID=UPI0033BFC8F7